MRRGADPAIYDRTWLNWYKDTWMITIWDMSMGESWLTLEE